MTVDKFGDVIYVESPIAGGGVGNYCAATPSPITDDYTIPLDNYNYHFDGNLNGTQSNNVGIGLPCNDPFNGKLHVLSHTSLANTTNTNAGYFENRDLGGIGNLEIRGVMGVIPPNSFNGTYIGGDFYSLGFGENKGVSGTANRVNPGGSNIGGYFTANNADFNAGIVAFAPIQPSSYAGLFQGDVMVFGDVTSNNISDGNLKTNVTGLSNAVSLIQQLAPKTFNYDTASYPQLNLNSSMQYGLIAQDVEPIMPTLIKEKTAPAVLDSLGNTTHPAVTFKTINYTAFIPVLIKAMQEQQQIIDSLNTINTSFENRLLALESCMNNLPPGFGCSSSARLNNTGDNGKGSETMALHNVELSDKNNVVLNQNVPNPFAESTTISYNIPENVKYAQIVFSDQIGRIIKTVDINEKGQGMINVFASDLSSGIYSYSLIIDGVSVDSKKMVKTK